MSDSENMMENLLGEDESLTEKQKKIIIAAIESFSEKGYASTSTSEIAKKAGVAEGTIFRHYKTKKDLLISIVTPIMSKLIAPFVMRDLNKVLDTPFERYEDFLKAMIINRRDFLQKNFPILKIMLQEIPFQPELREQFKKHVVKNIGQRLDALAKHYQGKGEIIEIPTLNVIRFTASTIIGYLLSRYLFFPEADWNDEEEIDRTIQFIMHGLSAKRDN
ncbi:TetR/AcrR family transcriptional regulator [Bacillus sp. CGMCC 1.16607]|uniref:TetR/AcrR family transcriptional regulator n=1 Tax=Bacillus sp. CGMCC 1.16607 TaxID=3351842 RepID=UPI0036251B8A